MAVDPQVRELARRLKNVERQALQRKLPTLAFSAIDDGAITGVDADGNLTIVIGKQHDGTTTATSVTGPVPPTPVEPLVTPGLASLRVYWDGTFKGTDAVAPMDFSRVTIHAEPLSSFTEPDPIDPRWIVGMLGSATGGEVTAALPPVEHVVYLVAWTESGKFSDASVAFGTPQDPEDLVGGEVIIAPTTSPVPEPVVGPASVVVNYTPIFGSVTDLHVWLPPVPAEGDDYATPTGITPDASTLHTQEFPPGGFIYTDVAGLPLAPDRPVWVALQARNATPPAAPASVWVQSAAGSIDPAYLELLVGSVIAQRLQAETLSGVTITGSVLDILDALYAEPGYMEVKADLVEAKSAIFSDNVTRRGTNNFLEGTETASAGITDPGTPPTLSATWPMVELEGFVSAAGMHVDETTREIVVLSGSTLGAKVYDLDSGVLKRSLSWINQSSRNGVDITRIGDWYYIASVDNTVNSDDQIHIYRYSALSANEGVRDATYDYIATPLANINTPASMAIAGDTAGELTIVWISENNVWRMRRINAATQATTMSGRLAPDGPDPTGWSIAGVNVVVTGSDRQIFVQPYHADQITWGQYGGVLSLDDATSRVRPFGEVVIAASGRYTMDAVLRVYKHVAVPDNMGTINYTYTWYDSDPAGDGLAETMISPARAYRAPKGSYIRIKTPMPPDDGTVDAPDTVRIYAGNNLQGSHFTPLELASGRVIERPNLLPGTQPPATSGFDDRTSLAPGAYEASKGDANGPMWQLVGTGAGRMGPWEWDADGNVISQPEGGSSVQAGTAATGTMVAATAKSIAVTFPTAFPSGVVPIVTVSLANLNNPNPFSVASINPTNTGFTIQAWRDTGTAGFNVNWTAVAPS